MHNGKCSRCVGKACASFLHLKTNFRLIFFQHHTEDKSMIAGPGGQEAVIRKELQENKIEIQEECNKYVFTNCRNVKPREIQIQTKLKSHDWQVGFFDAYSEVYLNRIDIWPSARFSSVVRNYWWNGKEGDEKKEGYYSLIKLVKELKIKKEHINDLLDYVEGRYEAGEHWQLRELDRNIELRIKCEVEETTIERLSKYFNNIWCEWITTDLKTENSITYNCDWYKFKNCKGVIPQKLIINTVLKHICFDDAVNKVYISEIVMEEKTNLKGIIRNKYGGKYKCEKYYSILPHIQTLVIRNNPKVLHDLVDYINGRYQINNEDDEASLGRFIRPIFSDNNWQLHKLNKNIKIVIEKPGIAFSAVKEITSYFTDVLVDGNKPEQYLARQQSYQKQFQEHFDKYNLETNQIGNFIPASQEFKLEGRRFYIGDVNRKFNIGGSGRKINLLYVNQKLTPQQFVCFHDTDEPVVIDKIVIEDVGDLRCALQNAYYNGTDIGFFSLLQTAKELEIHSDRSRNNQILVDLADYIEGKYVLNVNWKQEELDRDMEIIICSGGYGLFSSLARRLRNYFKNVFIDRIYTLLKTENVIYQECENQFIFSNSRQTTPQKLVINTKLMGGQTLILFNQADSEVHIPEIAINEKGCFSAIVRNEWLNNKKGDEKKSGYYSLVQHVQTLTIRKNTGALKNFADYVVGKYEIKRSNWKWQQLSRDIRVVIEGHRNAFLPILRIANYFKSITIDGKQSNDYIIKQKEWNDPDYKAFRTCFGVHGLFVYPFQFSVEFKKFLWLIDYVYNIKKSMNNIYYLTIKQRLNIDHFICFHDIDKPITVNKIVIDDVGDLRNVLQNAHYKNGKTGFFSLLETAKKLEISNNEQAAKDLADYVDGEYILHPKWERQMLDKNMEVKINGIIDINIIKRLRNYFKNVNINTEVISTLLQTENVIDYDCKNRYIFTNCRDVNPQKLLINAKITGNENLILFNNADCKICIPKITIGKRGNFNAIVHNKWQNCKNGNEEKYGIYSLIQHMKSLTIRNNPEALENFADYVVGKYMLGHSKWKLQQLSRDIMVIVESPGSAFLPVLGISNYFNEVTVDGKHPENYLATWELWNIPDAKAFRACFEVHRLLVKPFQYGVDVKNELQLMGNVYNIRKSVGSINSLTVRQKLDINQFVCFHDINKPITVNKILIEQNGDLRNMLQNAYYINGQSGFFSLLKTAKRLEIHNNEQAVEDLVDYVDGKYVLNPKWERQALNSSMEIKIYYDRYHDKHAFSLDIAIRLRNYFINVYIDCIQTPLQTENVIDYDCKNRYIFTNCRDVNPQKLVVNAKLTGSQNQIMFSDADGEVYIPEITIGEYGSFDAILHNQWQTYISGIEYNYYSLISHVKTLIIQNNPEAIYDLDKYVSKYYWVRNYDQDVQKLSKNIVVRINGVSGLDEQINRLKEYFSYMVINGRKSLRGGCYQMLTHINSKSNDIRQKQVQNKQKQQSIDNSVTSIQDARRRIERARARLRRRRARFQEYLALIE